MKLTGKQLKELLISGAHCLHNDYEYIDKLNVYPVPDGDTGSNMNLTATSGAETIINADDSITVEKLTSTFSRGLLMGARGNSGVILSQVFRGFADGLKGIEEAEQEDIIRALGTAKERAYKSVMEPVEGTILTVIRMTAENTKVQDNMSALFEEIVNQANIAVEKTPELLKELKDAGVVDSGGTGLLRVFQGMSEALKGNPVAKDGKSVETASVTLPSGEFTENYGYCTEFMIHIKDLTKFDKTKFEKEFETYGDSIVTVQDENILKLHIHSKKPGEVMNYVHQFGEFIKIKIENMSLQVEENHQIVDNTPAKSKKRTLENDYAIVAVSPSKLLSDVLLEQFGINVVVGGGQSDNPSTKDFLDAIEKANAKKVILLPNNRNIILAAETAKKVETKSNVIVVESKSITEGMSAALAFDPSKKPKDNQKIMRAAIKATETAAITYAVKDATSNGIVLKKDDFIAVVNKKVVSASKKQIDVIKKALKKILKDKEILTIITGEGSSEEITSKIEKIAEEQYGVEVDIIIGEQPLYSYILGAE